ncbi:MAG: hypothetical protein N3F62_01730 [Bacteroidia bacterium]|nr:hypothetical protein [Bacteroidia bacterium]
MKKQIFTLTSILIASLSIAQNIGINATGVAPNSDAGLDINFSNKGVLIPRVSLNTLTTFSPPITTNGKTNSLLIFNTNSSVGQGYYYWDSINNKWIKLVTTGGSPSDAWLTLGNAGTNPATHFVGTTDNTSLVFRTNNIERMRLHFGGQLSIGDNNPGGKLDVHQETSNDVARFITYGSPNDIRLRRTQGTKTSPSATSGANTILGRFFAEGYNGSSFTAAAAIEMSTDATGGTSTDMPGRITFSTTPDNTGTLQERMRINNQGQVGIGTTSPVSPAILDVTSTNKGVIFPRIALSGATDNITVSSPIDGIMIYNTSTTGTGTNAITPGYYYWQSGRWTKFQTSGYAGVVMGVHNPTTPNHLTTLSPSWQYTGAYIDLPPGKWVVFIFELLTPSNAGTQGWDITGTNIGSIWCRSSLSNSNTVFTSSPDIIGSPFVSGSVVYPCWFGMTSGCIYIYNSSGTTKRYYYWANMDRAGATSCNLHNFATNAWGENQFFAIPAE